MLLTENIPHATTRPSQPESAKYAMPAVEAIAGYDAADGGTEVVVVRRSAAGPWFLAGTETQVSAAVVARLAGRTAATPVVGAHHDTAAL